MKLLICIKQVPDMESRFKVGAGGSWYDETDLAWRMNEYDEYAVEQAVQLKEQLADAPELTVLSIGPDRVLEPVKKALAMGCDRGVHVQDAAAAHKDPWQIASIIAAYARDKGFDLILTGMQSQDRGSAQVGVLVAEQLGIPCSTTMVGFAYDNGTITAKRELEGGLKGVVKLTTPLPDPAEHHEGEEKGGGRHCRCRPAQGTGTDRDGERLPAAQKGGRHRPRRRFRSDGGPAARHPQRKISGSEIGERYESTAYMRVPGKDAPCHQL